MREIVSPLSGFGSPFGGRKSFNPIRLFAAGEQGAWFEPSPTTCFTDTARTTPASVGQTVAGMTDLSGNDNHATQDITSARPILARVPASGRRNILAQTATLATQSRTVTAAQHALSFRGTGTVTLTGASTSGPLVGTGANDIVSLTFTPTAGSLTLTVSGTVNDAQLELGAVRTGYQLVADANAFDVTEAGQPDNFFLSFDGIDDFLSIASFDPAFDKVQVFAGVRKLSDANRASIVTGPDLSNYTFSLESPGFANAYEFANIMSALRRAGSTGAAPDTSILTAIGDFDLPTLANPLTQLRRNGVIAETNTGSLGATAGNYKAGVYTIGCREGTSQFLNGQVYSLVMRFGANLSLPTIERTEKYVASKTAGVTLP
jgi:hypothetical protein